MNLSKSSSNTLRDDLFFLGYPSYNSLPRTPRPSCTPYLVPFVTFLFCIIPFCSFPVCNFFYISFQVCAFLLFVSVEVVGLAVGRGEARRRDLLELVVSFLGWCVCG